MNITMSPTASPASTEAQRDHSARMLMLRGVVAIAFGVLAIALPGVTLALLVGLFAAYALLSGAVSIAAGWRSRASDERWWLALLLGIVGVAAGVYAIADPALTALALVLVMGANAIVTGALDIAIAIRLRGTLKGHWMLVLSGLVSIGFGLLVFFFPGPGALALVWLISLYAVVTGALLVAFGLRTRHAAHALPNQ